MKDYRPLASPGVFIVAEFTLNAPPPLPSPWDWADCTTAKGQQFYRIIIQLSTH